jgi:hypothetical protein
MAGRAFNRGRQSFGAPATPVGGGEVARQRDLVHVLDLRHVARRVAFDALAENRTVFG